MQCLLLVAYLKCLRGVHVPAADASVPPSAEEKKKTKQTNTRHVYCYQQSGHMQTKCCSASCVGSVSRTESTPAHSLLKKKTQPTHNMKTHKTAQHRDKQTTHSIICSLFLIDYTMNSPTPAAVGRRRRESQQASVSRADQLQRNVRNHCRFKQQRSQVLKLQQRQLLRVCLH